MSWVLILTLITSNGAAVTHVPMTTFDNCSKAGDAWLQQMNKPGPGMPWRQGLVSCVPA